MPAQTVSQAFAEIVAERPAHCAMVAEDGRQWTYAELDTARLAAARAMFAAGVNPGDRVAIWAENSAEWVIAGLALHSLGAALVPINTRMKGPEAAYILDTSGAGLLFCTGNFLDQYYPDMLRDCRPESLREIVVFGQARGDDTAWDDFLAGGAKVNDQDFAKACDGVTPDSVMDVMFTSGTTGKPKGVITQHEQNLRVIRQWCAVMGMVPEDRYLIANPFFHAFGYKVGWLGGLLSGCTILPHAVFDAAAIIARIEGDRISVLPGPPTLFISLLNDPTAQGSDLSSLRATITGAAAVAPSLIERIRSELGFEVVLTGYGLTETCGIVSLCAPDDSAQTIVSTCGKPVPDTEVRIVDSDNQPLPQGETGEICVRGYNVMQGYFDNPAATAEAIDTDGFLHTGDVGLLDEAGYIRITDRLKDMYICGGFNCYPAEIENTLAGHAAIAQVAVVGVPDARMGEVGKACVVLRGDADLSAEALIDWARERMANYKVPRQVAFMDTLPMNASGKVLKFQLRD